MPRKVNISKRTQTARARAAGGRFRKAPPERSMRRRSPSSAPRLYEWLTSNGYIEPVTTYRRKSDNRKKGRR